MSARRGERSRLAGRLVLVHAVAACVAIVDASATDQVALAMTVEGRRWLDGWPISLATRTYPPGVMTIAAALIVPVYLAALGFAWSRGVFKREVCLAAVMLGWTAAMAVDLLRFSALRSVLVVTALGGLEFLSVASVLSGALLVLLVPWAVWGRTAEGKRGMNSQGEAVLEVMSE